MLKKIRGIIKTQLIINKTEQQKEIKTDTEKRDSK
jgi:hypothetical protein